MPVKSSVTFIDPRTNTDAELSSTSASSSSVVRKSKKVRRAASVGGPDVVRQSQKRFLTDLQDEVDGMKAYTRTVHKIATDGEDMRELPARDENITRLRVFNPRLSHAIDKYSSMATSTTSAAEAFEASAQPVASSRALVSASYRPSVSSKVLTTSVQDDCPCENGHPCECKEVVNWGRVAGGHNGVVLNNDGIQKRILNDVSMVYEGAANWPHQVEAFYQLVDVRPRVIQHKVKVRPQVESYEVSYGGGHRAAGMVGRDSNMYLDEYCNSIVGRRRSRAGFLDDYALDSGYETARHCGPYVRRHAIGHASGHAGSRGLRAITSHVTADGDVMRSRRQAIGDATINVSKKKMRALSPPPAFLTTDTPTSLALYDPPTALTPLDPYGVGRIFKKNLPLTSSYSNEVDLIGKRSSKIFGGAKTAFANVSLADGLEFIRSMLGSGSGFTLADAVHAAKSADIDPYGKKARLYAQSGDGWVAPMETWREKVQKWEREELALLEEEQRRRRSAAFAEWEERMSEADLMNTGREQRVKQLQQEWAETEVRFRDEAIEAEKARVTRLEEKKIIEIEEFDVGAEAKKIKADKEKSRKDAFAKMEEERCRKEMEEEEAKIRRQREMEEEKKRKAFEEIKQKEEAERKRMEEEERIKREAEEAKRKKEEEEKLAKRYEERKKREEEERIRKEEEKRIRKEEEEKKRLEEEEKKKEEEEMAKKFGVGVESSFENVSNETVEDSLTPKESVSLNSEISISQNQILEDGTSMRRGSDSNVNSEQGFGSFGADPWADHDADDEATADEDSPSRKQSLAESEEAKSRKQSLAESEDAASRKQSTVEAPLEEAEESIERKESVDLSSANAPAGKLSYEESQVSSEAMIAVDGSESGVRKTTERTIREAAVVIEEEEETTIVKRTRKVKADGTEVVEEEISTSGGAVDEAPQTAYSVTSPDDDDGFDESLNLSTQVMDTFENNNSDSLALIPSDQDGSYNITDYNTETYEHEDDAGTTAGKISSVEGEKEYSTTNSDGSTTTGVATFKASMEEEVTILKTTASDIPTIEFEEAKEDSWNTTRKTSSTEEESSGFTTKKTRVTEEEETTRVLKQKAAIDTHDHEIIIYNKDSIEITRVTHGDVIVGFDKVDEVVMVKHGLVTVSHENGECLVRITDGEMGNKVGGQTEVNVFEFDGEVVVRSLIDVAHKYLVPKKTERKLSIHQL